MRFVFCFPLELVFAAMKRNLVNLLIVAAVILSVVGCFFRSEKSSDKENYQAPAVNRNSSPPAAANAAQPDKNPFEKNADAGDFIVEPATTQNGRYAEYDRQLKREKVLESAAAQLNQALILPFDIRLRATDCGETNAFYNPNERTVTICYELMEYYYKLFKAAGQTNEEAAKNMHNAVRFAFLHEVGHALIDAYRLPLTGNEEDAADRCSAYISLEEIPDGARYVLAAADAFAVESKLSGARSRNLADEHLLQEQRFYNSLCMIYGSNPAKYANIVGGKYLPETRAARCPSEYERTIQSWRELLKPWRKD